MKKVLALVFALVLALSLPVFAQPEPPLEETEVEFAKARIVSMEEIPEEGAIDDFGFELRTFAVELQILSGAFKGQTVDIKHVLTGTPAYDIVVHPGERVLIGVETIQNELVEVVIVDHERDRALYGLGLLFVALLIGLGGKRGLYSLLSLVLIGILILYFFIPLLLRGFSPITLAIIIAAVSTAFTIALVGGANRKAAAAIIGTIGGVLIAGVLAIVVGRTIQATGLAGQEAQMLMFIPQGVNFDFRGLLMAGIIIGALGAVMDIGMSIASAVTEVYRANPGLSKRELFWSGMNVGRDVMGTMANTLILAYTGGALALLLLVRAYNVEFIRLINMDSIASEVLRALAGSIGLVAAIPITALAAAWLVKE